MSSVVVMTEGRHDVEFLTVLHQATDDRQNDYDTFIARKTDVKQERRIQQHRAGDRIRSLYKAEGGRSMVIKKFRANVLQFGADDITLILVVDLDGEGYDAFQSELNEKLDEYFRGEIRVESRTTESNDHFQVHDCAVTKGGETAYHFDLIAFHDDLEAVTGIEETEDGNDDSNGNDDGDEDGEDEEDEWRRPRHRRKIRYYLSHCPDVCADVRRTLL